MNIEINEEKMNEIITNLDKNLKSIEDIYDEINNKMTNFQNSEDVLSSIVKDRYIESYKELYNSFINDMSKLESLKIFLEMTLENYKKEEKNLNYSVDNNFN